MENHNPFHGSRHHPQISFPMDRPTISTASWEFCSSVKIPQDETIRSGKQPKQLSPNSWMFIHDYLAVCHFYSVHPCLSTKISVSHLCGDHFPRTHSTEHAMSSGKLEKQVETSCGKTLRATNLTQHSFARNTTYQNYTSTLKVYTLW